MVHIFDTKYIFSRIPKMWTILKNTDPFLIRTQKLDFVSEKRSVSKSKLTRIWKVRKLCYLCLEVQLMAFDAADLYPSLMEIVFCLPVLYRKDRTRIFSSHIYSMGCSTTQSNTTSILFQKETFSILRNQGIGCPSIRRTTTKHSRTGNPSHSVLL